MAHHQNGLFSLGIEAFSLVGQEPLLELLGLLEEFLQGDIGAAVGAAELHRFRALAPLRFLGRETVLDFAAQEPTPGVQIDFQQVVAELGFKGLPLVGQECRCGVLCPP